jgi:AAA+ ATPase superfamily predicted ATPase
MILAMKFVDRNEEIKRLKESLLKDKCSFNVVYGRRRLGKSTLIKKVLANEDIYFLADRTEGEHQRILLAKVVAEKFADFDKVTYPDWESLFRAINYRATQKFTLCIDELPYLVEQSPELPSVLQKLIDEKELRYNIIVCGSSQTVMYGLFLDSTNPLYGRCDTILRLSSIPLPYIKEALGIDSESAIEEYAVWGGVPRYWELRENCDSLQDAIWKNIFSVNGTLYEEPSKLFQDDVKDITKTSTIMSYIGNGANRLSEIATRCNEPATNLSRPIKKLIDLGFLERDTPFGIDAKNAKKSLYKISDSFMAFYYKFVVPNRSFIELGRLRPIEQMMEKHFSEFVSLQWEKICRYAVTGNEINGVLYGEAHRWWGSVINQNNTPEQIEIDIIAESLDKKYLLVGECKWTGGENAQTLTCDLLRKASMLPFASRYTIVPMLFLKKKPLDGGNENIILPDDIIELTK